MPYSKVNSEAAAQKLMKMAVRAGYLMITYGAEIYRVEDTMERLLYSKDDIEDVEVVCTYTSIMASCYYDGRSISSIKKVKGVTTDLDKISQINDFSRQFVKRDMDLDKAFMTLDKIEEEPGIDIRVKILSAALGSGFFAMNIGGNFLTLLFTCLIICASQYIMHKTANRGRKYFMDTLLSAIIIAFLAVSIDRLGVPINYSTVITGCIYLLFPGVVLTNAVRDFMNRDLLAGTLGMLQAVFVAAAVAIGVGMVIFLHSRAVV